MGLGIVGRWFSAVSVIVLCGAFPTVGLAAETAGCTSMVGGLSCCEDSDHDGVNDCDDQCPGEPDIHSDSDGVADCKDECDFDSNKVKPGACGCGEVEIDENHDGVCDDLCPNSPKTEPGECGCAIPDEDFNDNGTADCNEDCQFDAQGNGIPDICDISASALSPEIADAVSAFCVNFCSPPDELERLIFGKGGQGECGTENDCDNDLTPDSCENDSDQDGTPDDCDLCPADAAKTLPGTCGCGVVDDDSDGDGAADCLDLCPTDGTKTAPGACGCGAADVDTDSDGTPDCNDFCPTDPLKTLPAVCGCGTADVDSNENGVLDCQEEGTEDECFGLCVAENPELDEDGDGVSNCTELEDETDPCDDGSFRERLLPSACAGPNGFFGQWNILTIANDQSNKALNAEVEYRDLFGVVKGKVNLVLPPESSRDVIVNDLGLEPDTYGTVCVKTNATKVGAWSGGLALYKERFDSLVFPAAKGLSPATIFDYALYYALTNPIQGKRSVPINTNSLGTTSIPSSAVANWVRLTDAEPGDGKGLLGRLRYFDVDGKQIKSDVVALVDGGRFDFDAHTPLGQGAIGMAEFEPSRGSSRYYIESSRYVYEGPVVVTGNFWTAYVIPNRAATGVPTIGRLSTLVNEIAIVELINAAAGKIDANFSTFDASGSALMQEGLDIDAKASRHLILTGSPLPAGFDGSAEVSGPSESIGALTLVYRFAGNGELLFAYAPAFEEPIGTLQRTRFNSFIGQANTIELVNSTDDVVDATIRVLNFDATLLDTLDLALPARGTIRRNLEVPADTYGTVVVESLPTAKLVVRNDVSRVLEYTIPFPGR